MEHLNEEIVLKTEIYEGEKLEKRENFGRNFQREVCVEEKI
jgi:hypothetical protein